jgi:hypothetical protein
LERAAGVGGGGDGIGAGGGDIDMERNSAKKVAIIFGVSKVDNWGLYLCISDYDNRFV